MAGNLEGDGDGEIAGRAGLVCAVMVRNIMVWVCRAGSRRVRHVGVDTKAAVWV
jgi:hypothetical protein